MSTVMCGCIGGPPHRPEGEGAQSGDEMGEPKEASPRRNFIH